MSNFISRKYSFIHNYPFWGYVIIERSAILREKLQGLSTNYKTINLIMSFTSSKTSNVDILNWTIQTIGVVILNQ